MKLTPEQAIQQLKDAVEKKNLTKTLELISSTNPSIPDWDEVDDSTFYQWETTVDKALSFINA